MWRLLFIGALLTLTIARADFSALSAQLGSQPNTSTGITKVTLAGHKKRVNVLAFSPDGRVLATGSDDKTVKLWDVAQGQLMSTLSGHQGRVYDLKFSPDGRTLATLGDDQKPKLWNVSTGQLQATLLGHRGKVYNLEFSPDGRMLVTGSDDGTAKLWDAATGNSTATLNVTKYGGLFKRAYLGEPDDLFVFPNGYFNPDGRTVLTISGDKTPKLWDALTGQLKAKLEHESGAMRAVFSPDGRLLATESSDNKVRLWDASTGRLKATLQGHTDTIYDLVFSPDGLLLATASLDQTARLWDVATGRAGAILSGYDGRVTRVAFSPDGRTIAAKGGYNLHTAKLWNVNTAQLQATLPLSGRKDDIEEIAFSPDGKTFVSSSAKTVEVWDSKTGRLKLRLEGARQPVGLSLTGSLLATTGTGNTVLLWNLSTP